MRRIILLVTVVLVAAAMMVATAMPALAAMHSPYDCRDTLAALYRGEELTPLQQQLVQTYPSFGACVQASIE